MLKGPKRNFVLVDLGVESKAKKVTKVTKNVTEIAKSVCRTKNVTEVTKNVSKVAKIVEQKT